MEVKEDYRCRTDLDGAPCTLIRFTPYTSEECLFHARHCPSSRERKLSELSGGNLDEPGAEGVRGGALRRWRGRDGRAGLGGEDFRREGHRASDTDFGFSLVGFGML